MISKVSVIPTCMFHGLRWFLESNIAQAYFTILMFRVVIQNKLYYDFVGFWIEDVQKWESNTNTTLPFNCHAKYMPVCYLPSSTSCMIVHRMAMEVCEPINLSPIANSLYRLLPPVWRVTRLPSLPGFVTAENVYHPWSF